MELTPQQKAAVKGSIVDPEVAAMLIALLESTPASAADVADLQDQIDALDVRVTALETP